MFMCSCPLIRCISPHVAARTHASAIAGSTAQTVSRKAPPFRDRDPDTRKPERTIALSATTQAAAAAQNTISLSGCVIAA